MSGRGRGRTTRATPTPTTRGRKRKAPSKETPVEKPLFVCGTIPSHISLDPVVEATLTLRAAKVEWNVSHDNSMLSEVTKKQIEFVKENKIKLTKDKKPLNDDCVKNVVQNSLFSLSQLAGFHDASIESIDILTDVLRNKLHTMCTQYRILEDAKSRKIPLTRSSIRFVLAKHGVEQMESLGDFYISRYKEPFEKLKNRCERLSSGDANDPDSDEEALSGQVNPALPLSAIESVVKEEVADK